MPVDFRRRLRQPHKPDSDQPRPRIFDHLDDAPKHEDRFFSHYARRMRSSEWWHEAGMVPADECGSIHLRGRHEPNKVTLGEVWSGTIHGCR